METDAEKIINMIKNGDVEAVNQLSQKEMNSVIIGATAMKPLHVAVDEGQVPLHNETSI